VQTVAVVGYAAAGLLLKDALIKISSVLTDALGVSGRAMIEALIAGQRNPAALAELAKGRARTRRELRRRPLTWPDGVPDRRRLIGRRGGPTLSRPDTGCAVIAGGIESAVCSPAVCWCRMPVERAR